MNDQQPSGKSLINEIEKLREAVLLLCELQKELTKKVDAVLMGSTSNESPSHTDNALTSTSSM